MSRNVRVAAQIGEAAGRGAVAGTIATLVMTAVMEAGQRTGLLGTMPPRRVAERAEEALGTSPPEPVTDALASVLHVAVGAGAGASYALARIVLPVRLPGALPGAIFALGFWTASYVGVLPALRVLPTPMHDRPGRPPVMVAAHVAFGAVLGALVDRLDRRG